VCYHNCRELARRGHSVTVFTAATPGAPDREVLSGVEVRRLRPPARVGNAPVLPQLGNHLRGFDLIHLHYPFILGQRSSGWRPYCTARPWWFRCIMT